MNNRMEWNGFKVLINVEQLILKHLCSKNKQKIGLMNEVKMSDELIRNEEDEMKK